MRLPVLFRDAALAVVDKPAGLPVEADSAECVVRIAARELAPPQGGRAFPRVVHRLDRGTSGCLLLPLNQACAGALEKAFDEGLIEKDYLVRVRGALAAQGAFDTAYGPDPRDRRRFTTRIVTPRRARLRWELISALGDDSLARVWLDTGRTHQIRVQFSEAGFPVVGDETYGVSGARLMLHAERLSFPHAGARITCVAPAPVELTA